MKDTNTAQPLCRNSFDEQFSDDMMAKLGTRVQVVIARLEARTQWKDKAGLDDRINTAVFKLLDRKRIWDPSRCSLINFLYHSIRSDIWAEIQHLVNFPESPLSESPRDDDDEGLELSPVETATIATLETTRDTTHAAAANFFSVVVGELRELAATGKDKEVLKLLGLYDEGVFDRNEIMRRAKWSARRYGTIYQRMIRMAQQLDDDVRESVLEALAN